MRGHKVAVGRKHFFAALGLVSVVAATLGATASPAEARRKRAAAGGYNPAYAAMVVDAKTGRTLHGENEDALRHPASVTKVMTLYLMFEELEAGRLKLNSPLTVSANASRQAPSKLGLRPGATIEVEDAIMALVTKSANDIAVVVAENISGSEEVFAEAMTRRARSIGMSRSTFVNASGLPDVEQVTTARDLVTLGRAIQDRFPRYYPYFGRRSFAYDGRVYPTHNKLLGRVEGVDGIKTGFTRMSGFNLLTSAKMDGRHIVAAVLGGKSGRSRDVAMASLVDANMGRAYAGTRTTQAITERTVASAEPRDSGGRDSGSNDNPITTGSIDRSPRVVVKPIEIVQTKPIEVQAQAVKPVVASAAASSTTPAAAVMRWITGTKQPERLNDTVTAYAPTASAQAEPEPKPEPKVEVKPEPKAEVKSEPAKIQGKLEPRIEAKPSVKAEAKPEPKAEAKQETKSVETKSEAKLAAKPAVEANDSAKPASASSGWVIQLAAMDDEGEARSLLKEAKAEIRALAKAEPYTEKVAKGGSTLWRARFSGFDEDRAQDACKTLKRGGYSCFAARS